MSSDIIIRSAETSDKDVLHLFFKKNLIIHRHLDWRQPLDWIGHSPFLMIEKGGQIQSLLICPSDIEDVYWIRIFATLLTIPVEECFRMLFSEALKEIQSFSKNPLIASIAYPMWMRNLLEKNGWEICQEVVQMRWNRRNGIQLDGLKENDFMIRKMFAPDLPSVTQIDQVCFEKIWQHSEDSIERAFEQSAYSTVAEMAGKIAGYQISTAMKNHAHIARLAVLPEFRRMNIGICLINDVLENFRRHRAREITVNTQQQNYKSLGLYKKLGFEMTSDGFPIYRYRI